MLGSIQQPSDEYGYVEIQVLDGEECRTLLLTRREYENILKRSTKALETDPRLLVVPLTWKDKLYRWLG